MTSGRPEGQADLSRLYQAIYLNKEQTDNIIRKVQKREVRFTKRFAERNKHMSHQVIQRRRQEYFGIKSESQAKSKYDDFDD